MTEERKESSAKQTRSETEMAGATAASGRMIAIIPVEGWCLPFDESLVRFHEAAHAVYADHVGLPVGRLWAGDKSRPYDVEENVLGRCGYRRGPDDLGPEDEFRFACLQMVGPYAAWRKATGETMPQVPFEAFVAAAELYPHNDSGRALDHLRGAAEEERYGGLEAAYEAMCREVARRVGESWHRIEVVARGLAKCGYLYGWKIHRLIWEADDSFEPPTDRPFPDLLYQWDKDQLEEWKSPGGWLYELIGPEQLGYAPDESEDEVQGLPGDRGVTRLTDEGL